MGRTVACDEPDAQPAWGSVKSAAIIARLVGNKDAAGGCDGGDRGAHRRHSAVRGGDDEGGAGGGERGRSRAHRCRGSVSGPGGPRKLARFADGAARPARPRQGGGADRGGDRAGVLSCAAGCGGAQAGGGAGIGARPSHCSWLAVPAGRAAACDLPVQARAGAGRGLWHAAARAATCASRSHRRNP